MTTLKKAKPKARKKSAPKAKDRKPARKIDPPTKAARAEKAVRAEKAGGPDKPRLAASPPVKIERQGFMWKLLERKEADRKARDLQRREEPRATYQAHYGPPRKKTG